MGNGWRWPYPHEVFLALMSVVGLLMLGHVFPADSIWARLCEGATLMFGGVGGATAAKHLPPNVKNILHAHDEDVKTAMATTEATPTIPTTESEKELEPLPSPPEVTK